MKTLYESLCLRQRRDTFLPLVGLLCILLSSVNLHAAGTTLYSITNGDWHTKGTWSNSSGGSSCNCIPGSQDIVIIDDSITYSATLDIGLGGNPDSLRVNYNGYLKNIGTVDISIRSSGKVKIHGTVETTDLIMYNGGYLDMSSTGLLIIHSDFFARNSSNTMNIDGYIDVRGNFDAGNSSNITGNGYMTVVQTSTFSGTGLAFGCQDTNCCPSRVNCRFPALNNPTPTPVTWLGVQLRENADGVHVFWQTASEENNSHFTIERSTNGFQFSPIGKVVGGGTRLTRAEYVYLDPTAPAGKLFYRIKQTDYNGKFEYSPTVSIMHRSSAELSQIRLAPNPLANGQNLRCTMESATAGENVSISVFNSTGTVCMNWLATFNESKQVEIPASNLQQLNSGMYTIRVQTPSITTSTWFFLNQ